MALIPPLDLLQLDKPSAMVSTDEHFVIAWKERTWQGNGGVDSSEVLQQIDRIVAGFISVQRRDHPGKWMEVARTEVPDNSPAVDGQLDGPDHFDGRRVRVSGIIYQRI